ncbi:MAG: hypothetical protein ACYDCO_17685 [Armatimonadota bacterium]
MTKMIQAFIDLFKPKCPRCGKKALKLVNSVKAENFQGGHWVFDYYRCLECNVAIRKQFGGAWADAEDYEIQYYFNE